MALSDDHNQPTDIAAANGLAAQLLRDEPALRSSLEFGRFVHQGCGNGSALIIGDQAEIPLLQGVVASRRDYRMALLAEPSDVVVVRHRDEAFEVYLKDYLHKDAVTYLEAPNLRHGPIALEALQWGVLGDTLDMIAQSGASLNLKAYLTTQNTWRLAKHLGDISRRDMYVCGPAPRVAQRANDKLWFTEVTRRLLGRDATPPTMSGYDLRSAAAEIAYLAKASEQVVAKVPDSAGSAGNVTLKSADLAKMEHVAIENLLRQRLQAAGWSDRFPILIGVWDADVTCSPSVQLWIPHAADGPPISEGVFEQRTRDAVATFVGATRSALPQDLQTRLVTQATAIATVLQTLGYFGRCSMDAVICAPPNSPPRVHWIECNGRWGGVSIPMTVAQSLNGGALPEGFTVVQEYRPDLPEMDTTTMLSRLNDLLLHARAASEGVVVTSPPTSSQGVSVNLLAMAQDQRRADALANEAMARLKVK